MPSNILISDKNPILFGLIVIFFGALLVKSGASELNVLAKLSLRACKECEATSINDNKNQSDDLPVKSYSQASQLNPRKPRAEALGSLAESGLCNLSKVSRRPLAVWSWQGSPDGMVMENSLNCSQIDEYNYFQVPKLINQSESFSVHQIEITDSESLIVISFMDLICDQFNCSRLTVFNITGQKVHDWTLFSSRLATWPKLEILDLTNSSLPAIGKIFSYKKKHFILPDLHTLRLDHNNITELNFTFVFERMPNLRRLSLANNSISNIYSLDRYKNRIEAQFESIDLSQNKINCDKNHLWLMKMFLDPSTSHKFIEYDQIKCTTNQDHLMEMTWSQRVSVLETQICENCECRSLKRAAIFVDCHGKNLSALPDVLPLNTKILNLTSNQITSLGLPHSSKNWENVTYVYLEDNLITSFQYFDLKFMRNLAALDIRKNKFREFPSHIFEHLINLDRVHLSDNPWLCDCESTFAFQEWLQRQFHKVGDKEDIMCGVSGSDENGLRSYNVQQRLSSKVIYRLSKSELCPQEDLEEPFSWVDIINPLLSITIVLVVSKVVLDYIYLHQTKRLPHFFRLNLFCK